jgi:glycosyltransferase involved in cell wall biosynthesis
MNREIYFLLPYYPEWFDGGIKYQTIVCNYFKRKYENVFTFGRSIEVIKSKYKFLNVLFKVMHIFRIITAIFHIWCIPRNSILILNNAFFLDYSIPAALNKYWKKHIYVILVHHLVQKDRPTYLRKKCETCFIKKADMLITVSNTSKRDLINLNLNINEIPIIYPGLDVNINEIPEIKYFPENPELLFVGSVDVRKGLVYLIEAMGALEMKNIKLNVIGKYKHDDYFVLLQNKINELGLKNNIIFHGKVTNEQLIKLFLESTIFVFPTLWEGYGMALAEAMAYGLPVVASRIPALEELVEDGKEGFLVEPMNSVQLYEALEKLLKNKNLLMEFSRNSILKSKSFPAWEESSEIIWNFVSKNYLDFTKIHEGL